MLGKTSAYYWEKLRKEIDWKLLVFLLLFLNVKLAIKIPAIVLIYVLQFDFKMGFSLKNSRLPLFYLIAISIAVINGFLYLHYESTNYLVLWLTGIGFWVLCILAIHQIKLTVERNTVEVIHRTIVVFFIINAIFSLFNLLAIIIAIHNINPYTYQGEYQKYFIGTGDYIKGITFDTSNTNAVLNAIGVIYFLDKKKPLLLLMCMGTLLLTGSNCVNIILLAILLVLFVFKSTRDQKSLIAACLFMLVVFMARVSPQNNQYVIQTVKYSFLREPKPVPIVTTVPPPVPSKKIKVILTPEQQKQHVAHEYLDSVGPILARTRKAAIIKAGKPLVVVGDGRIIMPVADINSAPYQSSTVTPPEQLPLVNFINTHKTTLPISGDDKYVPTLPGKVLGMLQTFDYFSTHPAKIAVGAGRGNLSSKLAFKATGLGVSGGYPAKLVYITPAFMANHLDLYLNFFSKRAGFHSLTNSPFSVYDQVTAEYGAVGLLALFIYYFGFFASQYQLLTYGIPLLFLMAAVFFVDYWFEQLSVIPFFELMLFLNMKEGNLIKSNK